MKIAVAQINVRIGDFDFNKKKITEAVFWAKNQKADVVVFPHCALSGFPLGCLPVYSDFIEQQQMALHEISAQNSDIQIIIDYFSGNNHHIALLSNGEIFDKNVLTFNGETVQIQAAEEPEAIFGDEISLQLGASRFHYKKCAERQAALQNSQSRFTIFINHIGAQTGEIFDGGSFLCEKEKGIINRLPHFEECFALFDTQNPENFLVHPLAASSFSAQPQSEIAAIHDALVVGIRDFFEKQGLKKAILGLSGGIDSAVVAALAVEAIGSENVWGILMPSQYSSKHSIKDAKDLAKNLGCRYDIVKIEEGFHALYHLLEPLFEGKPFDVTEENMQARIRAVILMSLSNKFGHILLNTSNKSELAVGYGTLYGDSCGALSVLGDLYKKQVFELAHYINRRGEIIPENSILKPPSAELRPGQKDSDSLPEYDLLDAILFCHIKGEMGVQEIVEMGYDKDLVVRILKMVASNEYKRKQGAPILQVSPKPFSNRPVPIGSLFYRK